MLDGGPVPLGDLTCLVADDGPEARDHGRPHDAAGEGGQLESPGNHLCLGYQRPANGK